MIYMVAWACIFLFPVVYVFSDYLSDKLSEFHWRVVLNLWKDILPFFVLFLLNNYWLAPRLLMRKQVAAYVVSVVLLSAVAIGVDARIFPDNFDKRHLRRSALREQADNVDRPPKNAFPYPLPDSLESRSRPGIVPEAFLLPKPPFLSFVFHAPFIGRMLLALLMLGANIAVKLFFKSLRDEEAMRELERHNLQSELDYLKYQINPHFFMNTLNNIHSLIDLDAEKAKHTLVELSRLMRYLLYETNNGLVPLSREVDFLCLYVGLMRIRYTDNVQIDIKVPESTGGLKVPPLLFISFVENAFKHGVSYRSPSFVSIDLFIEGEDILFHCANSRHEPSRVDGREGVGLENIKKRLRLLYDDRYSLSIQKLSGRYDVLLVIPMS